MRLLAILALLTGCAPSLQAGIQTVEKGLAVTRAGIDLQATAWSPAVDGRIATCKAKGLGPDATKEQRAQCLGIFGKGEEAEAALAKIRDAYDQMADALKTFKEAADGLAPFVDAVKK